MSLGEWALEVAVSDAVRDLRSEEFATGVPVDEEGKVHADSLLAHIATRAYLEQ